MTGIGKRGLSGRLRPLAAVLVVGLLFIAGNIFDIQTGLDGTLHAIEGLGIVGYAVFFAMYVVACVLLVPGSILTLGAGAVYGVVSGSILVSVSSTAGATVAFLVGRYLARGWVAGRIEGNAKFEAIDNAVGVEGWKIVGLTRLSPVFPFALLNYAYGLTNVRLRDYIIASWIGMLPGTVMYVYVGSLAKSLSEFGAARAGSERSPLQWTLYAVGLLATVGVCVFVTRIARGVLGRKIETGEKR